MVLKDYYNILNVLPTSTSEEIKKAYRKLALQYHPDTNKKTVVTNDIFLNIKEAYEILSDTKKRQEYHYKRFYKSYQQQAIITPEMVLQQSINLVAFVAVLDPYRIDYNRLTHQIMQLLDGSIVRILQADNHAMTREKIVKNILKSTILLNYQMALPIQDILLQLSMDNQLQTITILKQMQYLKQLYFWNKYKLLVALFVAVVLCIGFYYVT